MEIRLVYDYFCSSAIVPDVMPVVWRQRAGVLAYRSLYNLCYGEKLLMKGRGKPHMIGINIRRIYILINVIDALTCYQMLLRHLA